MNKKIKIIDLLCLISNGEEVPEYVEYKDRIDNRFKKMMVCKENLIYKLDQLEIELNDEVKIIDDEEDNPKTLKFGDEIILTRTNCDDIQGFIISAKGIEPIEDKDIPLIPDDELYEVKDFGIVRNDLLNYNFKVLKEKINQVVKELNRRNNE